VTTGERWKLLFQSVRGTAHERAGLPCQDRCLARLRPTRAGPALLLACADGAGSAPRAERGAEAACRGLARLVFADLADGLAVAAVDRDVALSWLLRLRRLLADEAERCGAEAADLACTLLLAVVADDTAVFAQVGDGAIVAGRGDGYEPVFWPQRGEYANCTHFLTDPDAEHNFLFERRPGRLEEVALLSDGLQMLALTFADRSAHQPFFAPMFRRLRAARPGEGLAAELRRFLESPAVNGRSDDDKTLVLATRAPAGAAANPL
jgi:hypothetical protein